MSTVNYAVYPSLRDRVAFVTGGGSGIGASIVEHFAAQQARVAFVDIDREASETLCRTLQARYGRAPLFIECDVRDIDALRKAIERVREDLGDVSALVNNAARDELVSASLQPRRGGRSHTGPSSPSIERSIR